MHVVNSLPGVPPWESAPEPDTDVVVRRLLAFAVDGVLVSLVTGIVCRPLTPLHLAVGPLGSSDSVLQLLFGKPTAPFWPLVAPVVLAYFIACEALFGLTPGKALAGLRVVNRDGTRAGLGPVVVRNLLRLVARDGTHSSGSDAPSSCSRRAGSASGTTSPGRSSPMPAPSPPRTSRGASRGSGRSGARSAYPWPIWPRCCWPTSTPRRSWSTARGIGNNRPSSRRT
jgi:uncharacterized RDD family membrane protein YckC